INYEGGFVRRGLPGEVLFALAKEGLNPYLLIIGVSLVIWLLLFLMLLRLASVRGFPALAICSQLCMLSPVIGHQIVRKDCLEILLLIFSLHFLQKGTIISLLLANVISAIAVLSHELYAFLSIPLFFIIKYAEKSSHAEGAKSWNIGRRIVYSAACISPLLASFALCIINRGDFLIAQQVWESWAKFIPQFPTPSNFNPSVHHLRLMRLAGPRLE